MISSSRPLRLVLALLAAPALAAPAGAASILCQGDCVVVGMPPVHGAGDVPFDFELGLLAEEGEDLVLETTASVYVYGEVMAGEVDVNAGDPGVVIGGGGGPIGGDVTSTVGGAPGLEPIGSEGAPAGSLFEVEGDVYLDVSQATLASLTITAGLDVVFDAEPVVLTPEPGSAALLGAGLAGLAARRRRRA